jgi:hypothetical protein
MADQHKSTRRGAAEFYPRDLVEFHLRWREFRSLAIVTGERAELPEDEREVIRWLVMLADRIGQRDIAQNEGQVRHPATDRGEA